MAFIMKRFLSFTLFVAVTLTLTHGYSAENAPESPPVAPKVHDYNAFKTFFKKKGPITETEVSDQFGPPDAHAPLYGSKQEPPSWWYYEIEKGERIGVAIEDHRVVLVTRNHRNKSIDVLRERASLTKP